MRRYNRIRRVTQYLPRRKALTMAGITSGAMAFCFALLLGPATGVASADSLDWEALAQCESGGHWDADTGNGFYGGLQFKESTWKEFGGTGSPAEASRAEQISVANRVYAKQGPAAWPKCGLGETPAPAVAQWQRPLNQIVNAIWSAVPR